MAQSNFPQPKSKIQPPTQPEQPGKLSTVTLNNAVSQVAGVATQGLDSILNAMQGLSYGPKVVDTTESVVVE